jgi:hypothetical protein
MYNHATYAPIIRNNHSRSKKSPSCPYDSAVNFFFRRFTGRLKVTFVRSKLFFLKKNKIKNIVKNIIPFLEEKFLVLLNADNF